MRRKFRLGSPLQKRSDSVSSRQDAGQVLQRSLLGTQLDFKSGLLRERSREGEKEVCSIHITFLRLGRQFLVV